MDLDLNYYYFYFLRGGGGGLTYVWGNFEHQTS